MDDIIIMAEENGNNARIVLTFLNNDLEVRGDFFPHLEGGQPMRGGYIKELLEKSNIVYGVNNDEINKAYKSCRNGEIIRNVLMAKGEAPLSEIPEYMQINPHLGRDTTQKKKCGAVDHRSRSPFIIVKKGQALAKIKSRKPGKQGINVRGEHIGYNIASPPEVSAGENTHLEGRLLLASINGQLIQAKGVLSVRDFLVIKGNVNYTTGNIIFPGNVEIHGTVSDGFKIYSGGSVIIKQTFDVSDSIIKNDLTVVGGIIGRGEGLIKVGGNLKTKFIENCRVACRKAIYAEIEVLNSKVYTLDTLQMGDKGCIVGGEVFAYNGISAARIGKKTGKAARLHCGIDFTLEQEKEKNNHILKMLAVRIKHLKELMEAPLVPGEKMAKMQAVLAKMEEEQKKAQEKIAELLGKIKPNMDAAVQVKGEIVPGTLIVICQAALYVKDPLKNVRIRLDRESNKIITESL